MKILQKKLIVLTILMVVLLTGCTNGKNEIINAEKHLVWGETQAVSSLDPAIDWQGWFTVRYAITETLFKLDASLMPQPWLASAYENIDETTWKIEIKEDIYFSNGTLLTPEMVVKNLKRIGELNQRAVIFAQASYETSGNSIIIVTSVPYPTLINDLCDPYASIVELDGTSDLVKSPIGTGPYVVEELIEKTQLKLIANNQYWDGIPNIKTVEVKFITDTDTMAMALQSGEVDVAVNLTSDHRTFFENNEDFKVEEVTTARAYFMYFNLETLRDSAVRKAISMSIDKEGMKEYLFDRTVTPAIGAFPDSTTYGSSHLSGQMYDLEGAKKVLDDAGYKDTNGDGILDKEGLPLEIKIVTYKRLKNEAIVTEIQSKLKSIGIQADVEVYDNTEFFKTGAYDIGIYSIVTTPVGDSQSFLSSTFSVEGVTNFGGFSDPVVTSLLEKLSMTFDQTQRAKYAIEIQQVALDANAFDNIGFVNMAMYMKKNVSGLVPHPTDYYQMNAKMNIE